MVTLSAWWQWLAMQASRRLVKLDTFQGTCCLQRLQLDSQTSVVSWPAQPALYHPVCQSVHRCCHKVCYWSEAAGKMTWHSQIWSFRLVQPYVQGIPCKCVHELLSDCYMTRGASLTQPELTDDIPFVMLLQHRTVPHLYNHPKRVIIVG